MSWWSIKLDPDTTVREAAVLMECFGCRCHVTVDFEVVLYPRHPQHPAPTARQLAALLEHGLPPQP